MGVADIAGAAIAWLWIAVNRNVRDTNLRILSRRLKLGRFKILRRKSLRTPIQSVSLTCSFWRAEAGWPISCQYSIP